MIISNELGGSLLAREDDPALDSSVPGEIQISLPSNSLELSMGDYVLPALAVS